MKVWRTGELRLYRVEDGWDYYTCKALYKIIEFSVIRETDKCYVIRKHNYYGLRNPTKYVLKDGKNIYAWDSLEKAMFNYLKRKEFQEHIIERKLNATRSRLQQIKVLIKVKNKTGIIE